MLKKVLFYSGFLSGLLAVSLLIGVVLVGSAGLDNWLASRDARWTAWIVKRKQAMIREPGSGRLIVVAGSNGLFGISAADLGKATGRTVFNAATHASLGYPFIDVNLLSLARRGDIVLMPLENGLYTRNPELTDFVVATAHQVGLTYFLNLGPTGMLEYVRLLRPGFIWDQYRQFLSPEASRKTYDRVSRQGYWRLGLSPDGDVD
ncbi:MAG: hypothetical protein ABWY78_12445, partial [Microvirga sp.]